MTLSWIISLKRNLFYWISFTPTLERCIRCSRALNVAWKVLARIRHVIDTCDVSWLWSPLCWQFSHHTLPQTDEPPVTVLGMQTKPISDRAALLISAHHAHLAPVSCFSLLFYKLDLFCGRLQSCHVMCGFLCRLCRSLALLVQGSPFCCGCIFNVYWL